MWLRGRGRRTAERVHELGEEIAALGLALEVLEQVRADITEAALEADGVSGALRDFLAAGGEIFFERLGVPRELGPELLDLPAQVFRAGLALATLRLAAGDLIALRFDVRLGGASLFEDFAGPLPGALGPLGDAPVLGGRLFERRKLGRETFDLFLIGRHLAQHAGLFVGELLHLAADFGPQRASPPLELLELAGVARDLAFEAVGLRRQIPRLDCRLRELRRGVRAGIDP